MKAKEFARRRKHLMELIGSSGIAIVVAAPERIRSRDTHFVYRQDSDFFYLTGFLEPDHAARLALHLVEFAQLRSCLVDLLGAADAGRPLPDDAVERLNETSARVPRVVRLGDAGVSVEPLPAGHVLTNLPNVVLSAHSAFRTPEANDNLIGAALGHCRGHRALRRRGLHPAQPPRR